MKFLLPTLGCLLALAYAGLVASFPDSDRDVPLLYWVTDPAPNRADQIDGFHRWLVDQGHVTPDGEAALRVQLDAINGDQSKLIIQGVSGVAGELFAVRGGGQLRLFEKIGLLADVTEWAQRGGYSPAETWPALEPEITVDGRQYTFPANAAVRMYWVNTEAFEARGLPLPPRQWTWDEFESAGKAFVAAANTPGERRTAFFANDIPLEPMHRSVGLSVFNETLTACDLDDPRYVDVLKRRYRWVYEDNLLPTPGQQQSIQGQARWGGAGTQLFVTGRFGMFYSGRYMVMPFRQMDAPRLAVSELPHGGFPNHRTTTRSTAVYRGASDPELASRFHAYLASDLYNMNIVESGDALPPRPEFTKVSAFTHPPDHPNEWGCHEVFAEVMQTSAIGGVYSPYVLQPVVDRMIHNWEQEFVNGLCTAEEAAAATQREIDSRIARNLTRDPSLQRRYDEAVALQKRIDARLAAGERVPAEWIANPFYLRYYAATGRLETPSTVAEVTP